MSIEPQEQSLPVVAFAWNDVTKHGGIERRVAMERPSHIRREDLQLLSDRAASITALRSAQQRAEAAEQVSKDWAATAIDQQLRAEAAEARLKGWKDASDVTHDLWQADKDRAKAAEAEMDALKKLAAFGAAMLHAHRGTQACELGDIDGFDAQEHALRCGVLEERLVTEPCGESCVCAEVTDLPTNCYFTPADIAAAIRSLKTQEPV